MPVLHSQVNRRLLELLTIRHDLIYTLYYLLHAHRPSPHSSSLLASAIVLSYVRCNVCSAPSQASACPPKMFHIPCPVLVLVFLSLYILCVLSALVIAIEILESFVATPAGIGGRRLYHSVLPLLCYSPSYHWTVYTGSALAFS